MANTHGIIDDVDDDEQYQPNFTKTFPIILELTLYAFQSYFCLYCGDFDGFRSILGKFRSLFILPPPSNLHPPSPSAVFVDAASVRKTKKIGKGGESSRKKHVTVGIMLALGRRPYE